MKHKLSVLIITKNEEKHLIQLLPSLNFTDEILVVDSYSTDKTKDIAEKKGARVLERKFDNHAAQKNWGLEQVRNDWVLIIDADERIPELLKNEILNTLENTPKEVAFWIKRTNFFMGEKVKYSGWQNDRVIRLIDKNKAKYESKIIHEEIVADGKIGQLRHNMVHHTYKDFNSYFQKFNDYSTKKAIEKSKSKTDVTIISLIFKPFIKFLQVYLIRLGILDGKVGAIISIMTAYESFLTNLKIWRMKHGETF